MVLLWLNRLSFGIVLLLISCTKSEVVQLNGYMLYFENDECVYSNHNHSAFTSLILYNNQLWLAFREAPNHKPNSVEEYGRIRIMRNEKNIWETVAVLAEHSMDLRDPFFVILNDSLRLYMGYNQFREDIYEHAGTVYSDFSMNKWSDIMPIVHDVPHVIWLWKIREYNNMFYGVGYLENEKPILLNSIDGIRWTSIAEMNLEGVLSEADLNFINDSCYICLRRDIPVGSSSLWGKAKYPFTDFEWSEMKNSIASPELFYLNEIGQMLLSGREYAFGREGVPDSINVAIFLVDRSGNTKRFHVFDTGRLGDKGYPSFAFRNNRLFVSYYTGNNTTEIRLGTFCLE